MGRWAYPEEVRLAAVRAYVSNLGTQDEICAAFECSRPSLGRWLRRHRANESLAPSSVRGKPLPKLDEAKLATLKSLVEQNPDKTYEELAALYNAKAPEAVSRSTIMRAVWALGFTWKKNGFVHKKPTKSASRNFAATT